MVWIFYYTLRFLALALDAYHCQSQPNEYKSSSSSMRTNLKTGMCPEHGRIRSDIVAMIDENTETLQVVSMYKVKKTKLESEKIAREFQVNGLPLNIVLPRRHFWADRSKS